MREPRTPTLAERRHLACAVAMTKRIAIIQGHPDPRGDRFGHALANAYRESAADARYEVRAIDVVKLDFSFLRTKIPGATYSPSPA